jgi:hypothetical protein
MLAYKIENFVDNSELWVEKKTRENYGVSKFLKEKKNFF